MNSETSKTDVDLTGLNSQENQSQPTEPEGEKLPEGAKNWQHALQLAREREDKLRRDAEEAREQAKRLQEEKKQADLAKLSETDRYKAMATEEAEKRAQLELKLTVSEQLAGKNLPKPIVDLLTKSPWVIPAVQDELGSEYTWDEVIDSVKRHLPRYVESLVVETKPSEEPQNESSKKVDSERSVGDYSYTPAHVYTLEEVNRIKNDPAEWEKHRVKILKQLQASGGRL